MMLFVLLVLVLVSTVDCQDIDTEWTRQFKNYYLLDTIPDKEANTNDDFLLGWNFLENGDVSVKLRSELGGWIAIGLPKSRDSVGMDGLALVGSKNGVQMYELDGLVEPTNKVEHLVRDPTFHFNAETFISTLSFVVPADGSFGLNDHRFNVTGSDKIIWAYGEEYATIDRSPFDKHIRASRSEIVWALPEQRKPPPPLSPDDYTFHAPIRTELTIHWSILETELQILFDYNGGKLGWLSFGIPSDNKNEMPNSRCIIAKQIDENGVKYGVDGYDINDRSASQIEPHGLAIPTSSVIIDITDQGTKLGIRALEIAGRPLTINGQDSIIYAWSESDGFNIHDINGYFQVNWKTGEITSNTFNVQRANQERISNEIRFHAFFMTIGFLLAFPLGALAPLLLKRKTGDGKMDDRWFRLHRFCQLTGMLSVFFGFVGILIVRWDHVQSDVHGKLGVSAFFFMCFQIIVALFCRPNKDKTPLRRKYWNYLHLLLAYVILALAIANSSLGLERMLLHVPLLRVFIIGSLIFANLFFSIRIFFFIHRLCKGAEVLYSEAEDLQEFGDEDDEDDYRDEDDRRHRRSPKNNIGYSGTANASFAPNVNGFRDVELSTI